MLRFWFFSETDFPGCKVKHTCSFNLTTRLSTMTTNGTKILWSSHWNALAWKVILFCTHSTLSSGNHKCHCTQYQVFETFLKNPWFGCRLSLFRMLSSGLSAHMLSVSSIKLIYRFFGNAGTHLNNSISDCVWMITFDFLLDIKKTLYLYQNIRR